MTTVVKTVRQRAVVRTAKVGGVVRKTVRASNGVAYTEGPRGPAGGNFHIVVSATPPSNPEVGDFWFLPEEG